MSFTNQRKITIHFEKSEKRMGFQNMGGHIWSEVWANKKKAWRGGVVRVCEQRGTCRSKVLGKFDRQGIHNVVTQQNTQKKQAELLPGPRYTK